MPVIILFASALLLVGLWIGSTDVGVPKFVFLGNLIRLGMDLHLALRSSILDENVG